MDMDMDGLVAGLATKADKIRALSRAGHSRSRIADFLGISYQHVRNVQVDDARKAGRKEGAHAPPAPDTAPANAAPSDTVLADPAQPPDLDTAKAVKIDVASNGWLTLPPAILEAVGLAEGGFLLAQACGGEIRLVTPEAAMRRRRRAATR